MRDHRPGARAIAAVTAFAGLVAAVLGWIGLRQLPEFDDSFLNVLFGIVALFAIDGGFHTRPNVPASLEVAQLLAPAITVVAALLVLNTLARERVRRHRARRYRNHSVVVGSGTSGLVLLKALDEESNVVVIDREPSEHVVVLCDRHRWALLRADAVTDDIITRASIGRARSVFIGTGSDTRDVAIARRLAREVDADTDTVTRIHVRLDSNEVARALIAHDHELRTSQSHDIDYVSRHDFSAMLTHEHLLVQRSVADGTPLDEPFCDEAVFVGDNAVTRALHDLLRRSHAARSQLGLSTFSTTIREPSMGLPLDVVGGSIVFIGFESETETLHHTLGATTRSGVRLVVALVPGGFKPQEFSVRTRAPVRFIDSEALLDGRDMLDQGQIELMARLIHADYLAKVIERGQLSAAKPAHTDWSGLTAELRERNRQQARRFLASLERSGRRLALLGEGEPVGPISPDELEREAVLEHELWLEDHRGWVWGEMEDRAASPPTHPQFVPWEKLTAEVQEYDRDAVRRRPALAALLGLQIVVN